MGEEKKKEETANECGFSNSVRTCKGGRLWMTLHLSWSHGNLRAEQRAADEASISIHKTPLT